MLKVQDSEEHNQKNIYKRDSSQINTKEVKERERSTRYNSYERADEKEFRQMKTISTKHVKVNGREQIKKEYREEFKKNEGEQPISKIRINLRCTQI